MTIKQQGGVFGRNPTFQDVSVDGALDLADGVKASFGTSDDLQIFHSGTNSYIQDLGTGSLYIQSAPNVLIGSAAQTNMIVADGGAVTLRHNGLNKLATTAVGVSVTGNVAVTDGGGIDFSATSGTGTSELFDDYEEGTWTPSAVGYGGTPTVSGFYTKIGELVYIECSIIFDGTADNSGFVVQGLPYAVKSPYLGGGSIVQYNGGATDTRVGFDTLGRLRIRTSADASISYDTIGVNSTLNISATYRTA